MIKDFFNLAIRNLKKRRLRSWLTMLGIFISIATIFVLIALSLGLQGAIQEQFDQLGVDKLFIQPKGQLGAPGTSAVAVELSTDDVEIIKKVSGVKAVSYMTIGTTKIEFNDRARYFIVAGMNTKDKQAFETLMEASGLEINQGKMIEYGDDSGVIIGSLYNDNLLFKKEIEIGNKITLNGQEYKVMGIVNPVGNPSDDQNIYMTFEAFQNLFNSSNRVDVIYIQITEGENLEVVSEAIKKKLDNFRDVDEKTRDYSLLSPSQLLETFGQILLIITAFLGGIAAISLLVGGIGIANTMYTSVIERTKEIGIMKAVGARNKDIMLLFLIEAGLLGFIGAAIGVLLGFGVGKIIEFIAINYLNTNLLRIGAPLWLILGCLTFGFLIGTLSGLMPAWRASKTNVIDALRYE